MIPQTDIEPDSTIPEDATFWMPDVDDLGEPGTEGGIAYFRDTWFMGEVTVEHAVETLAEERNLITLIDRVARTAAEFDRIATELEYGGDSADSLPADLPASEAAEELRELLSDEIAWAPQVLEGLELGVAGLVYALCAFGCITAASCRGHHDQGRRRWSDRPVVFFAASRDMVEELAPLVGEAGCGFAIDDERPDLLFIEAPSVACTMRLAEAINAMVVQR